MQSLSKNPFHTVQNYVNAPDEKNDAPGQQGEFICVLVAVVVRRVSRGGIRVLSLHGVFESNR